MHGSFRVTTTAGVDITADIWFRCFGVVPNTELLAGALADIRRPDGRLAVTDTLQVKGQDTVLAVGDITDIAESKRGSYAKFHAGVVAANIKALITATASCRRISPPRPPSCCHWAPPAAPARYPDAACSAPTRPRATRAPT
ncbi:hypothetical protein [Nocardia testacea]|uniref:hypothetical protein n=1 Tax=Nocardia testacea TaxID=248551 RepID=UPI0033D113EC